MLQGMESRSNVIFVGIFLINMNWFSEIGLCFIGFLIGVFIRQVVVNFIVLERSEYRKMVLNEQVLCIKSLIIGLKFMVVLFISLQQFIVFLWWEEGVMLIMMVLFVMVIILKVSLCIIWSMMNSDSILVRMYLVKMVMNRKQVIRQSGLCVSVFSRQFEKGWIQSEVMVQQDKMIFMVVFLVWKILVRQKGNIGRIRQKVKYKRKFVVSIRIQLGVISLFLDIVWWF